jgi:hypothetical protein
MMPRKSSDPIKAAARRSKAQRKVGEGATCLCGEARPLALEAGSRPMTCAACRRRKQRKKTTDAHHVAGRRNSHVTIGVPVNDHRAVLSPAQYEWPKETLENPEGSPLRAAAASLRGLADTILYLLELCIGWIVEMLEQLDKSLTDERGAKWWIGTPVASYAP